MNNCYFCSKSAWLFLLINTLAPPMSQASVLDCKELYKLTNSQVGVIYKSYDRGAQDNLGYTLAAISWRESSLGKYRVNPTSSDYGAYGINYKTIQRIDKVGHYQSIKTIQEVIFDDDKGVKYALETLRWNLRHFKGDWSKALAMYNKGHQWRSGDAYVKDISIKVRQLRTCYPKP